MMQNAPILVMNPNQKRESGSRAQLSNIQAALAVSDIVKSTLGPKSMLKMLIDPMGGIVITNDGNCILRELDVSHPAAKTMLELSRAQDENVGDGTTSVIIVTGELLKAAEPFLRTSNSFRSNKGSLHPVVIVKSYYEALSVCVDLAKSISHEVDITDDDQLKRVVESCIGTKYTARHGGKLVDLAIGAVRQVSIDTEFGREIDIKRYVRVEKIPGGEISETRMVKGVILNKDVTHAGMRRRIENPRVILLDCSLEYKRMESQATVELAEEKDFDLLLKQEEEFVMNLCADIISHKPDLVFTEKGVSDLAQHFLMKAGITVLRRLRKTDNNRLARALGVNIAHRTEDLTESNVSTKCGLFEVRKIGDEYFSFIEDCEDAKACTVVLRGGSKDVLNEMERNLQDCLQVVRNVALESRVVVGGGCFEMSLSRKLQLEAELKEGAERVVFNACSKAFEVIPRTLLSNCGCDVVRQMTKLRALHAEAAEGNCDWGVDGETGEIVHSTVVEALAVKAQIVKTAFEAAAMILRIDDIISGITKGNNKKQQQ